MFLAVIVYAGSLYWPFCSGGHLGGQLPFDPQADEGLNPAEPGPMPIDAPSDRRKRGYPYNYGNEYFPGGGSHYFPGGGIGAGTALATGNALNGITQTNGRTFTDAFGNANSNANGLSQGYMPSSTSVANSNSRGFGGIYRRRREAVPSFVPAGMAAGRSAGNAVDGRAANSAITYTDPYGAAKSQGAGFSHGYVPSSVSEVRSDTNAPYVFQSDPFAFGY